MTRINCGISPSKLCDKHLLAEHRELIRIPNTIKSGKAKIENIPNQFKLGQGHVKFFYNKNLYLQKRYKNLYVECVNRGFVVKNYLEVFDDIPPNLFNDYKPTLRDIEIIQERINERLSNMKNVKYTKYENINRRSK